MFVEVNSKIPMEGQSKLSYSLSRIKDWTFLFGSYAWNWRLDEDVKNKLQWGWSLLQPYVWIKRKKITLYYVREHNTQKRQYVIRLAPPLTVTYWAPLQAGAVLFWNCAILPSVNMAGIVATKCRGSLAFLTRTLSVPEFTTQCCYHKKVKHQ